MEKIVEESYRKNPQSTFKTLLGLYRGNYSNLALSTLFFTIKHIPSWVMPITIANVINAATTKDLNQLSTIYFNAVLMAVLVLQNLLTNYFYVKFQSRAIRKVEAGLRGSLIKKLQELSIPYQKDLQSGRLQSKIMRDVEAVQTLSSQVFTSSLNIAINLIVALAITLYKSPLVFMFFLLTVPIAALIIVFFRRRIKTRNQDFRKEMEETSAKVIEVIELAPIARAHNLEKQEINRLNDHFYQIYEKGFHLDVLQSVFGSVSWASFQYFQIICLVFTGALALKGQILPGDVVMYQTYFTTIVNAVSSIITLIPTIAKGMESVSSIGEILNAGEVEDYKNKTKLKLVRGKIEFRAVSYRYPKSEKDIIQDLNLTIDPGETIAFVGESGSGKSTLVNLVIGFIAPTKGKIFLDDQDSTKIDMRTFRKKIAVVPQNTILFSGTIQDNITYGLPNVSSEELQTILKASNLSEMIQQLPEGLETMIGEHGDKLSGGQRQRVSIARALIRHPDVIILDEATSALDNVSEKKIQEALQHLTKDRTTLIVAHRLSTIRDADKIAVVSHGTIVEFGTYDELITKKGAFYQLKQLQL
ncbi:ABC transporter ATP-binding protein [Enterococcus timonensis]|uniref:ABC transporter ATP-binding protein n=1 Tax=Enterococcus timonensis TaxID=1852364 RepID=UPI0008D9E6E0|nr:ABC transporter ATP-binding protein [Enterococcus timonensis]